MQDRHLPALGPRYWTAILLASVCGANCGDFASRILHLGHVRGLPLLAIGFAGILLGARRAKSGSEAWYWLAIVTLRMAATNLADLVTHDLRLADVWVLAALAALLCGVLLARRGLVQTGPGLAAVDGGYWLAMLTAGTLGTAAGDAVSDMSGVAAASAGLILVLGGLFAVRAPYWVLIVAIRTAGTSVGDWLAGGLGLPVSTALTGVALVTLLLAWSRKPASTAGRQRSSDRSASFRGTP